MNATEEFQIAGKSKILSVDYNLYSYIALTEDYTLHTPYTSCKLKQKVKHPIVRIIDNSHFIVAGARTSGYDNALIFDMSGSCIMSFYAGDGVEDMLVHDGKLIFSYFDEGVYGSNGPNNEGLAVFGSNGKLIFGYNSSQKGEGIDDCYSICKAEKDKIFFYAYTPFILTELSLSTYKCKFYTVPDYLRGSHAISEYFGSIIFFGSYTQKKQLYKYEPYTGKATGCGSYIGRLQASLQGRFIDVKDHKFSVITPML